jgi:Ala-tRNA(Pro) deacylase
MTLSDLPPRLTEFLDRSGVEYEVVPHPAAQAAREAAEHARVPARHFAKVVLVRADGRPYLLVMPAQHRVDLDRVADALGAMTAAIAPEDELARRFPDAELGAEPPFGALYDLPVLLSGALGGVDDVLFAGTQRLAVRMGLDDFRRLLGARVADFSRLPEELAQ